MSTLPPLSPSEQPALPGYAAQPRRKGVWQLIVGILLFLASVPVALAMSITPTVQPIFDTMETGQSHRAGDVLVMEAWNLQMVALSSNDIASGASCSLAFPSGQGNAASMASPLPGDRDGVTYELVYQLDSITVTELSLDCTGTTDPIVVSAPLNMDSLAGYYVGAFSVGTVLGLAGIGLIIWGAMALSRSGRQVRRWRAGHRV